MYNFMINASQANDRASRGGGGGGGGGKGDSSTARVGVRHPRSIMHPQFKNLTHLEAEQFLKEVS